jgi:hypothetical protein
MAFVPKSKPPRLPREFYQGFSIALWTHTFEDRATGWLNDAFHLHFREILLHTCHRYGLANACYVLMPDHWHLVWMGLEESSDQWLATAFLRKNLHPALGPARLQDRAHDHVLREKERERGAIQAACSYVIHNPQRARLCGDSHDWQYLGAMVPGYPKLDPRSADFWDRFWKIYNRLVVPSDASRAFPVNDGENSTEGIPALTRRATIKSDPEGLGRSTVARSVRSGNDLPNPGREPP